MSSFEEIYEDMQRLQMPVPMEAMRIKIDSAKKELGEAMCFFLNKKGEKLVWLPEYDEVADWLEDNRGKGLFLFGQSGRGKSLIGRYVLPAIILKNYRKVLTVTDMQQVNKNIDLVLSKYLISLDDVGTEQESVIYGERRLAFAEVMDAVEKEGKLIIVSTNLNVDEIRQRYGNRTLDRIKSTMKRVLFRGESFRN